MMPHRQSSSSIFFSGCREIPRASLLIIFLLVASKTVNHVVHADGVAILPEPPTPTIVSSGARTNCPHLQSGLANWNDAATWSGVSVPSANADITLPANTQVLLTSTPAFAVGKITIPSTSELIIGEDPTNGIELQLKGMDVQGKLTIGSETCRIEAKVTLTLIGARPANAVTSLPAITYKGIAVNGTLNLHGKRYYQTWSRLAQTVSPGATVLALKRPVNWEAGQQIVLVTSSMHDTRSQHQNEVLTVASVSTSSLPAGVGALVTVTSAVQYKHIANQYYQVEVGLLSRSIVVQGSSVDSEPTDPDPGTCVFTNCGEWYSLYEVQQQCTDKSLTGFGGHMVVYGSGKGYVEGVELYRMGQTNVLGRYPMHFHILGNNCPGCYLKDSSIHRSYYRCISVHGTNSTTISENVAYDVTGYCYYLEDGVEEYNSLLYNLVAHVHTLGPDMPTGCWGQTTDVYTQSENLTLPADVTASGFYITNVHNYIVGNAASGGWSGFAFPSLGSPLGPHRDRSYYYQPVNLPGLVLDGNTAHSTGFWWEHAGAFYLGGALYYTDDNKLQYNPGRSFDFERDDRRPCNVNPCIDPHDDCLYGCPASQESWLRMTNSKAFLAAGVGLNSWSGRMELINFESYDSRLSVESLSDGGFWIDNMFVRCRTGENLGLPSGTSAAYFEGSGFYWYDTGQSHIITNAKFQNCGYRSTQYAQYDQSPTRGCGDDANFGCSDGSTVFGFLTHSDEFTPEIMQGTKNITFTDCGRRFKFTVPDNDPRDTVSGRGQNWLDTDGSVSGLREPTLIGSGFKSVKSWWRVDSEVVMDQQAPLAFIKQNNGPERAIGHIHIEWDAALHATVGNTSCGIGDWQPCPAVGYMRHLGYKFSPAQTSTANNGLLVTANPDIVGPVGGFGWRLKLNQGAPRVLNITQIYMSPNSTLMLSIAYPAGTTVTITAKAAWCDTWDGDTHTCQETFKKVSSVAAVRNSLGNTYFLSSTGVLTFKVVEFARFYTGNPTWAPPNYNTPDRYDSKAYALPKFGRNGVLLPQEVYDNLIQVKAKCSGSGAYCSGTVANYDPDVCQSGYKQVAYDACCNSTNLKKCTFANGRKSTKGFLRA